MTIFISWSGPRSKAVAEALHGWLKLLINAVEPWVSSLDIEQGSRWHPVMTNVLSKTKVGILCLTPENVAAPWILFEAGALAKTLEKTFVCPYLLFGARSSDLPEPLTQFQVTTADKAGTRKLADTLNRALTRHLSERQLDKAFELLWPNLTANLKSIRARPHEEPGISRTDQMIAEIHEVLIPRPSPFKNIPTIKGLRKQVVRPLKAATAPARPRRDGRKSDIGI